MVCTVVFTREEDGKISAEVPALPGCVSWGRNLREARKHILEAIDLYLEVLSERGEKPAREVSAEMVEA